MMHGFEIVFPMVAAVWVLAVGFGWAPGRGHWLVLLAGSTIVYMTTFLVWWYVLDFDIVYYDILRLPTTDSPDGKWVYILPPYLPVVAYARLFKRAYGT